MAALKFRVTCKSRSMMGAPSSGAIIDMHILAYSPPQGTLQLTVGELLH